MQQSQPFITRLKTTGQEEQTESWVGSVSGEVWKQEIPLTEQAELMWSGLGAGNGQNDLRISRPAWWVYEKKCLIHSRALPKWLQNIPRQLPRESMAGETKSQEPWFWVLGHSLQPPWCVFLYVVCHSPYLINYKTPESRSSVHSCPLSPSYARQP